MIPYEDLVSSLAAWRARNGLPTGAADYLGEPPPPQEVSFAQYETPTGPAAHPEYSDLDQGTVDADDMVIASSDADYADPAAADMADDSFNLGAELAAEGAFDEGGAQPEYADAQPEYADAQPEYADAQPEYADAQPEYSADAYAEGEAYAEQPPAADLYAAEAEGHDPAQAEAAADPYAGADPGTTLDYGDETVAAGSIPDAPEAHEGEPRAETVDGEAVTADLAGAEHVVGDMEVLGEQPVEATAQVWGGNLGAEEPPEAPLSEPPTTEDVDPGSHDPNDPNQA